MTVQMPEHSRRTTLASAGFAAEAAQILDEVRRAMTQDRESAHAAALRLVTFLTSPTTTEPPAVRGGLAPWQKRKIERYMNEHLERQVRLDELAEQALLSVSHFCRAFKESFGDTPHGHIVRQKLKRAQELMLTTNNSLSQIALACGLADQAHLSKIFRRELDQTPNTWRRENLLDSDAGTKSVTRRQ